MTFFKEKIIISFNHEIFSMNYSCFSYFLHELVIEFRSFMDE